MHVLGGMCMFSGENTFREKVRKERSGKRKRERRFSILFYAFSLFHTQLNCLHISCVCVCVSVTETKKFWVKTQKKTKPGQTLSLKLFLRVLGQPSRHGCFSSWESFHPLALNAERAQIQQEANRGLVRGRTATRFHVWCCF